MPSSRTPTPPPGHSQADALSWEHKDRLWLEVVRGVGLAQSQVPDTPEARKLRRALRREWAEMRRQGIAADFVKD